jgi:hypothetical protein
MNLTEFGAGVIRGAFPASAQRDLNVVLELLPRGEYEADPGIAGTTNERGRWVVIDGQTVQAFDRIYNSPLSRPLPGLTDAQLQMLGCLFTRHYDGFVRERHLDYLLSMPTPWTPMFVLQLLGEYVVEIATSLKDRISILDRDAFVAFRDANRDFVVVTCERIVSYWLCYYTSMALAEYPAYRMMKELGLWDGHQGARWLRV